MNQNVRTAAVLLPLVLGSVSVLAVEPKLSIFIGELSERHMVLVYGQVKDPGTYSLRDVSGLLELVEKAGGFTESAHLRTIRIYRGGEQLTYDARSAHKGQTSDFSLHPGDVIFVNEALLPQELKRQLMMQLE